MLIERHNFGFSYLYLQSFSGLETAEHRQL